MARSTGESVKVMSDKEGKTFTIAGSSGQLHKGTIVIKPVYCGKKCKGCPHKFYKYAVWRENGKTRWKYISKVEKEQTCQPTQKSSGKE
jgi:hypothetical protein